MVRHTMGSGALILGLSLLTSSTAAAQSGTLSAQGDIYAALSEMNTLVELSNLPDNLLAGQLQKRRTVRKLRSLQALLKDRGVAVNDAAFEAVYDTLEQLEHEHVAKKRAELRRQFLVAAAFVSNDILKALPSVAACDVPDDDGGKLFVFWQPLPAAGDRVKIRRKDVTRNKPWKDLTTLQPGGFAHLDKKHIRPGRSYAYRVVAIDSEGTERPLGETAAVKAVGNLFHWGRASLAGVVLAMCLAVTYYISLARRGVELNIRKIAGLEAVDEAVGRATEMGRPIFFIPGIQDMNDIQTIAGITVLGRVARVAAERDAILEVPTARSLVMTAARETVHASYQDAGRPDAYDEKKIYYTTDEQFGYVAAVTGAMVREKPATCFYMGAFFAESLILAETANVTGSIQIAGTAMPAQLPFFVAACDYTLIGEEFFAASAYLSGEPQQLGSLKGQDIGKIFGIVLIVIGGLFATLTAAFEWRYGFAGSALDFVKHTILETAGG